MPSDTKFNRLAIIGVGLIGGSLARALRAADACTDVIGCGRNIAHLKKAVSLGVIDDYKTDVAAAVKDADMVVIAVPLGSTASVLQQMLPGLSRDATITDVGSAKVCVMNDARDILGERLFAFVPGHPIAGTEKSGVEASSVDLFRNHCVILTPLEETGSIALQRVRAMWTLAGAEILEMDPHHHDEVLAATSHLPHVLAYTLVDTLTRSEQGEEIFRFAAGGFRDFTRIASSDPVMWRDICLANRDAILDILGRYTHDLARLENAIKGGDGDYIIKSFSQAKQQRDRILMNIPPKTT